MENKTRQPVAEISLILVKITLASAILYLILLLLLHFIKPEFDPSWRFISEYAIGDYGWIMQLAFFVLAISCLALCLSIKSEINTVGRKIGLAILFIVGASNIYGHGKYSHAHLHKHEHEEKHALRIFIKSVSFDCRVDSRSGGKRGINAVGNSDD